jgi:hypothetical protein
MNVTLRPNVAALRFDQVLHDRKAGSASSRRALPRRVGTIEAVEDARALIGLELAALIANGDHDVVVLANGANPDAPMIRRVARRVGEQVHQHLPKPNRVGTNGQVRRDLGPQTAITSESGRADCRLDDGCDRVRAGSTVRIVDLGEHRHEADGQNQ